MMDFKSLSGCPNWNVKLNSLEGLTPREVWNDDPAAYSLANSLILLSNVWDDLIDKDNPVSNAEINGAFFCALCEIPQNPFFQTHRARLQPLLDTSVVCYLCANEWEKNQDEHGKEIGHIFRYVPALVIGEIVNITHGRIYENLPILYKALCGERREEYMREQSNA